jgi:phage terminase small subunit
MPNIKKSIAELKATGSYRPGRDGVEEQEVKVAEPLPPAPDWISEVGAQEWERIIELLGEQGALKATDLSIVAVYCELFAEMKTRGLAEMDSARITQFRLIMQEIGLSPVSRNKLKTDKKPNVKNDFDGI